MRRGGVEIDVGSKKKKDEFLKKKRTITSADNILEDPDEALELAVMVSSEEESKRRQELITKERQASLIGKQGTKQCKTGQFALTKMTKSGRSPNDGTDQTRRYGVHIHDKEQQQPTFKPLSPTITCSSQEDVNRFLNDQPIYESTDKMCGIVNIDAQTTFVVPIPEGNHEVTSYISGASEVSFGMNVDVKIIVREKQRKKEFTKEIMQKLVGHEQKLNALSQLNVAETIEELVQVNVLNEVKNQLPKLYNALINFMAIDEMESRGDKKKKKRKNDGESSLKEDKAPIESSNYETYVDVDEPQEQEVPTDVS
ncbi:hypothetical protein Tco_0373273 [Tanacetum coccineum]